MQTRKVNMDMFTVFLDQVNSCVVFAVVVNWHTCQVSNEYSDRSNFRGVGSAQCDQQTWAGLGGKYTPLE